jgi:3-oxo-5-alpha-steroid 4-dehydrogenase 1
LRMRFAETTSPVRRLEWSAFAFAAGPLFIPIPPLSSLHLSGWLGRAAAGLGWWPTKLLSPGWMFVLAEISAMTPRAIRGHRWYRDTFRERFPRERKVVIPGLF